jgi:multiple antibiotic resistance protein
MVVMGQAELTVNFFVALFALIDPIGNVPVFAAATVGAAPRARRLLALYIGLFSAALMILVYFSGLAVLGFFGISLPAFRIAGGLILFLLGLDMVRKDYTAQFADAAEAGQGNDDRGYARRRFERLVVPFAMPLLIGPGALSTVIIYASESPAGLVGLAVGVGVILAVCLSLVLSFWATPFFTRVLGRIGMAIVVRIFGLILCAMAVQFIIGGVTDVVTDGLGVEKPMISERAQLSTPLIPANAGTQMR